MCYRLPPFVIYWATTKRLRGIFYKIDICIYRNKSKGKRVGLRWKTTWVLKSGRGILVLEKDRFWVSRNTILTANWLSSLNISPSISLLLPCYVWHELYKPLESSLDQLPILLIACLCQEIETTCLRLPALYKSPSFALPATENVYLEFRNFCYICSLYIHMYVKNILIFYKIHFAQLLLYIKCYFIII